MLLSAVVPITRSEDADYLDKLYRKYYSVLWKLAVSLVKEEFAAEDIVNNAMLSLFSKISDLRLMDEPHRLGYLKSTVRNKAFDYLNSLKCKNLTAFFPEPNRLFFSESTNDGEPEAALEKNELYRNLQEALATLPVETRKILYLKYATRLTVRKIADLLGVENEAAIHVRISRARRKILQDLRKKGWGNE